jgi:hypothetical protein
MHYIAGTRFDITIAGSTRREKLLPHNNSYQLLHILKEDNCFKYIFYGSDRNRYELKFDSCRDADNFIAKYRNEKIPDYDALNSLRIEAEIDNIAEG